MEQTYYNIKQVSKMLGLHEKTLQRYIREGRLKAGKIGKEYRITGDDLSAFTEAQGVSFSASVQQTIPHPRISVSAVVDIAVKDSDEADRIETMVIAGANGKGASYGHSTVSVQRIDSGKKLRILLWGSAAFIQTMLSFIEVYDTRSYDETNF